MDVPPVDSFRSRLRGRSDARRDAQPSEATIESRPGRWGSNTRSRFPILADLPPDRVNEPYGVNRNLVTFEAATIAVYAARRLSLWSMVLRFR
jgi:hypothetical protein